MTDLKSHIDNAQTEIFHLAILPQYKTPGEWDNYQEFLQSGKFATDAQTIIYLRNMAHKIDNGVKHICARVIDAPPTQFQIYQVRANYIPSAIIGTEFYFIERDNFQQLLQNEFNGKFQPQDFWLFDKETLIAVAHNEEGESLGHAMITDDKLIRAYKVLRQCLLLDGFELEDLLDHNPDI